MHSIARDLRLAARGLARTPGFLCAALVTLALGMGASTAIFSVANAVLLRKVPARAPERLVNIHRTAPDGTSFLGFSSLDLRDLREGSAKTLSGIAAFTGRFVSLRRSEGSELLATQVVSANYFELLGLTPLLGRTFVPADDAPGTTTVLVSERLWRRAFGADPGLLGRAVTLNGTPYTVAGIVPASFTGTFVGFTFDLWVPLLAPAGGAPADALTSHDKDWLELFGRLAPGVSREAARASLAVSAAAISRAHPKEGARWGVDVLPMTPLDDSVRRAVSRLFGLLLAVSGLVLLIACVNVAGLLLARGAARRREMAIRQAIGAGTAALARQLLAETVILFGGGTALGVALAFWLCRLLLTFAPTLSVPLAIDAAPDPLVLGAAVLTTIGTGFLFGLLPALRAARVDIVVALKEGPTETRPLFARLRSLFVVGQIAASMLLVVAAGLLVQSVGRIRHTDPGFDASNVRMASMDVALLSRDQPHGEAFYRDLLARAERIPGVLSAALVRNVPLGFSSQTGHVEVNGFTPPTKDGFEVVLGRSSPRAFETLRIPLLQGRDFRATDDAASPRVAVVNETFAARFWPGKSALGQRFRLDGAAVEVIGIARDGKYRSLMEDPRLQVTVPFGQRYSSRMTVLLRTEPGVDPTAAFRDAVRTLDPDLPVLDPTLLSDFLAVSFLPHRMAGAVTTALGVLGLVLASVGLYGLVAYTVGQRTREIGIRVAIGARPVEVVRLVLRQSLLLGSAGILVGLLAAAAGGRLLSGLLFGVRPMDPVALAGASLVLGVVVLGASLVPARRALRVNPLTALRSE